MIGQLSNFTTMLAAADAESGGGIGAIGIDPKALLFQAINFAIMFWILKKVAYKPIIKILEERRATIEESFKTAKEIEKSKEHMVQTQNKLINQAQTHAESLIAQAKTEAHDLIKTAENKAEARSGQLINDARSRIAEEVEAAKSSLKKETTDLVIAATAAIIEEKLDANKDSALIAKALEKVR